MTDKAIVELYFARDEHAIRESEAKYGAYCHTVAINILSNRSDAEECVNDTWMRAWNTIPPQVPNVLKLFFARITRNLSFNRYRSQKAAKRGSGEFDAVLDELENSIATYDVEDHINASELTESINRFLADISARDRGIFLRRYFYAESVPQIAERCGLKPGNVRTVLSRILAKLRTHLKKEGYTL